MAVTINDVAKLAGVSPSTVSRTCKNHYSISEKTKEKVRKAMEELGYEYSIQSHSKVHSIGIIFPKYHKETGFENPFYLEAIRGITSHCNQHNCIVTIISGNNTAELMKSLHMSKADGFIFLYSNLDDALINFMYKEHLIFVLIGKATQSINETIYVDNDNVQAAKECCEYLMELGHNKIGYIGTDQNKVFSIDRFTGYKLSLLEHDIPFQEKYTISFTNDDRENEVKLKRLLIQPDRPTAFLVCDDYFALSVEKYISDIRLKVPNDISLIAFNNSILSKMMHPQLTSIDVNAYQLGIEATSQLIKHIENPELSPTKIIVPYKLIKRSSCKQILITE